MATSRAEPSTSSLRATSSSCAATSPRVESFPASSPHTALSPRVEASSRSIVLSQPITSRAGQELVLVSKNPNSARLTVENYSKWLLVFGLLPFLDRNALRAPQAAIAAIPGIGTSEIPIIDLTTPATSPQQSQGPVFMSFSRSGTLVQSSIISPLRSSNVNLLRTQREDSDIIVLEVCRAEEGLAKTNPNSENAQQKPISISSSTVELLPETSPSKPQRQASRYHGSLIQPRKRRKC